MNAKNDAVTIARSSGDAIKAGNGEFIFRLSELSRNSSSQGYASSVVQGERIQVSLITKTKGDKAPRPHTHPNEQWNYILQGTLRVQIGNQPEQLCGPGTLLYFPANVEHATAAMPNEDVVFFAVKDTSHGMFDGKPVDKSQQ